MFLQLLLPSSLSNFRLNCGFELEGFPRLFVAGAGFSSNQSNQSNQSDLTSLLGYLEDCVSFPHGIGPNEHGFGGQATRRGTSPCPRRRSRPRPRHGCSASSDNTRRLHHNSRAPASLSLSLSRLSRLSLSLVRRRCVFRFFSLLLSSSSFSSKFSSSSNQISIRIQIKKYLNSEKNEGNVTSRKEFSRDRIDLTRHPDETAFFSSSFIESFQVLAAAEEKRRKRREREREREREKTERRERRARERERERREEKREKRHG